MIGLGIGIGAKVLKGAGKLIAKSKIGQKVAGKLAAGAQKLFSGKLKQERAEVKPSATKEKPITSVTNQGSKSTINTGQSAGFMAMVKQYWWVGAIVAVLIAAYLIFKPKKRKR